MREAELELTEDSLLGRRIRLVQPRRSHRAGTDAVLLAACVDAKPSETAYDLGAGVGSVGLIVAKRTRGARRAPCARRRTTFRQAASSAGLPPPRICSGRAGASP